MNTIEPQVGPTHRPSGIKAWVQEKIWMLIGAALFAVAGVALDRMSDEMNAWIRSIFVGGIGGTYVLQTFAYPEHEVNLKLDTNIVELKDGGRTVFGSMKQQSTGYEYRLFGYHRVKYLAMSYGGRGPLGSGTLALQTEIASGESPVFWGWRSSVECVGSESYFVQCPALMFLQGTQNPVEPYPHFLEAGQCRKVTNGRPPELCEDLKARP